MTSDPMPIAIPQWVSLHLHYRGGIYYDHADTAFARFGGDHSEALVREGYADRAFAIRYSEDGAHVRWRARALNGNASTLQARMMALAERWVQESTNRRAIVVPYLPETDRYGGSLALPHSEELFHCSTSVVASWIAAGRLSTQRQRLGLAVAAMLSAFHALSKNREAIVELARRYSSGYLTTLLPDEEARQSLTGTFDHALNRQEPSLRTLVPAFLSALDDDDEIDNGLSGYTAAVRHLVVALEGLQSAGTLKGPTSWPPEHRMRAVLFSHVHMTNNRIGIPIVEEAFAAAAIARSVT